MSQAGSRADVELTAVIGARKHVALQFTLMVKGEPAMRASIDQRIDFTFDLGAQHRRAIQRNAHHFSIAQVARCDGFLRHALPELVDKIVPYFFEARPTHRKTFFLTRPLSAFSYFLSYLDRAVIGVHDFESFYRLEVASRRKNGTTPHVESGIVPRAGHDVTIQCALVEWIA